MTSKQGLLLRRGLSRIVGLLLAFLKPRTIETTKQPEHTKSVASASLSVSAIPKLASLLKRGLRVLPYCPERAAHFVEC